MIKKYPGIVRPLCVLVLAVVVACGLFWLGWRYDNKFMYPRHSAQMGLTWLDRVSYDARPFLYLVDGWAFYGGAFLTPEDLVSSAPAVTPDAYFYLGRYGGFDLGNPEAPRQGSATYRMTVLTGCSEVREYALELPEIFSRWQLWINGELKQSVGWESGTPNAPQPENWMVTFRAADKVEIVVAIQSEGKHLYNGMVYPPAFGSPQAVGQVLTARLLIHAGAAAAALLIGILCLGLGSGLRFSRPYLELFFLCLCFSICVSYPLIQAFALHNSFWNAAERFCYYGIFLFVVLIQGRICRIPRQIYWSMGCVALLVCLSVLIQPHMAVTKAGEIFFYGNLLEGYKWLTAAYLLGGSLWAIRKGRPGSYLLLTGFCVFVCALVMDRLYPLYEPILFGWPVETAGFVMIMLIAAILAQDTLAVYRDSLQAQEEQKIAAVQLEAMRRYTAAQEAYVRSSERLLHETRNHYLVLHHYLQQRNVEKQLAYLNELLQQSVLDSAFYSENVLLNSILHVQFSRAKEMGIYIEYELLNIPVQLPIADRDLTGLLMNVLDNALKAAAEAEGERWLYLSVGWERNTFCLTCSNAKNPQAEAATERPRAPGHGYGLHIIREISRRYSGKVEIDDRVDSYEICVELILIPHDHADP